MSDGRHRPLDPRAELGEHGIADRVAVQVIDVLEVIQIDEHHARRTPLALGARERLGQAVAQQSAVGQTRERVMDSLVAGLLLVAEAGQRRREDVRDRAQQARLLVGHLTAGDCSQPMLGTERDLDRRIVDRPA